MAPEGSLIRGGSAPCPTPYPFIYHFDRKDIPSIYLLLKKGTPFTYLPAAPSYDEISEKGSLVVIFI